MKNFKLFLTLFLITILAVPAWGAEQTITLTSTSFSLSGSYAVQTATVSGYSFTVDKGYLGTGSVIQMNSSKGDGTLYNTTAITGLKSIQVNVSSGSNTYTITTGTSQNPTANSQNGSTGGTYNAVDGDTYFQLSVSGACYFSSIVITYDDAGGGGGGGGSSAGTGTINFGNGSGDVNITSASASGDDDLGNNWTITTEGTTSFTPNANYGQIGSGSYPATSITFTMNLGCVTGITAFSAKFGGANNTSAGTITLKIDGSDYGTGSISGQNDKIVTASGLTSVSGQVLSVTITNITKGIRCYYISYATDGCGGGGGGGGTYKITYDKNNAGASGSMSATNADGDGKATVAENAFSAPDGMVFAHWNTEADGSGDTYNKDDVMTLISDTTLYAQWVKSEVEIVEWFPDSIRIVVPDATDASVIIENKDNVDMVNTNIATDVFFSKYFEAAGYTKLVGIYNGTDHAIDISDLRLRGGTTSWSSAKGNHNFVQISDVQKLCDEYGDGTKGHAIMLPAGTEIILYSLVASNKSDFTGPTCMDKYVAWDDLANNVKPNWYRIGTYPTGTATEGNDTDGHNTLNFSGPYSVGLFRGSTLIDIIGAGNSTSPDNTAADYITGPITLGNGVTINTPNDKEGFYTLDGMTPPSAGYPNGYSTYLSTNLCLLIRKSHVTCGDSAVLNNEDEFKTIGPYTDDESKWHQGEWVGVPIGKVDDRSCKSGQQFGYVGTFDYNDFFSQYEAITSQITLDGQARDDGTYNIPIPDLDDLACTMLKVKVYEGSSTDAKTAREYKVPIMVQNGTTVTTDEIFSNIKTGDYAGSKDICKDCDVVILKGATLTKTTGATDVDQIRDLMIYPGGKLAMPAAGGTYKVNSIQFRVEGDTTAPYADLNSALEVETQELRVSRRIRNKRYYFFSLPYACNIDDIRWSNGDVPVKGTEYEIKTYNGAYRAEHGTLKSWTTVPDHGVLNPGVGYNIAVANENMRELVFPMALGQKDLSDKETDKADATVEVRSYIGSATIENHNWNLIAHPYVARFAPYTGDDIKGGILVWNDYDAWERHDESNVYLTIPNYTKEGPLSANDYTQVLASTMTTSMDPFVAVFVQGKGNPGSVVFSEGSRRASAPGRHLAAKSEYADESIFVGVTLSGNGGKDQTNLRIRPDFNEEYQLGYDLTKFGTTSDERPVLYMRNGGYNLAFRAINDNNAAISQPMGVYCKAAGTYTFALSNDYSRDNIEAVYLYDAETQQTINLMNDTYEFTTTGNLNTGERFYLSAVVRRPAPQVTTDNELVNEELPLTRKILINGHVFIQHGGKLFDITGKEMLNH